VETYSYPGRDHAFSRTGGDHYNADDAAKAAERTLAFFKKALA
jgi:carboxymethylenebutenolidase